MQREATPAVSSRSASEGPGAGSASTMHRDDAIVIPLAYRRAFAGLTALVWGGCPQQGP